MEVQTLSVFTVWVFILPKLGVQLAEAVIETLSGTVSTDN
jgi:hypothetical protein